VFGLLGSSFSKSTQVAPGLGRVQIAKGKKRPDSERLRTGVGPGQPANQSLRPGAGGACHTGTRLRGVPHSIAPISFSALPCFAPNPPPVTITRVFFRSWACSAPSSSRPAALAWWPLVLLRLFGDSPFLSHTNRRKGSAEPGPRCFTLCTNIRRGWDTSCRHESSWPRLTAQLWVECGFY
jgi:hypothetical protein